jgi:short subunit fatty acids transporter
MLVGTFVVLLLELVTGEPLLKRPDNPTATKGYGLVDAWGVGFWSLITFTLQRAMTGLRGQGPRHHGLHLHHVPGLLPAALIAVTLLAPQMTG